MFSVLATEPVYGQNGNGNNGVKTGTINVAASIAIPTEVQLTTLRNMSLDQQLASRGRVNIDPVTDSRSGLLRAEGEPNALVQISFVREQSLSHMEGGAEVTFEFVIAGNEIEDQASAEVLDLENRQYSLNEDGEYYFWIGGEVNLENASRGSYEGMFTVEIEYP
ncbi:hypothetical protein [Natronogracilivirga saccharolytica]|nr:hypothetical protein [Natronogracilivirga saccharolytica]